MIPIEDLTDVTLSIEETDEEDEDDEEDLTGCDGERRDDDIKISPNVSNRRFKITSKKFTLYSF